MLRRLPSYRLFPYTTLFRSRHPAREWGTYFRFGYRRISWGLVLSLVDLVPPQPGELSRSSPIVSFSPRSEEHTSELQSQSNLVCRLLLEKKKTNDTVHLPIR